LNTEQSESTSRGPSQPHGGGGKMRLRLFRQFVIRVYDVAGNEIENSRANRRFEKAESVMGKQKAAMR
jgi:hypothetical protein